MQGDELSLIKSDVKVRAFIELLFRSNQIDYEVYAWCLKKIKEGKKDVIIDK